MGSKTLPDQGRQCLPAPARKRFFVREVTRFPAAAGRHPWPLAYPGSGVHHTTSCGTSSRNSGSSPWTAVRRRRVPTQGHSLLLQFAIVTAVSVQLCSLLDSSGRLQESSRKHALLQAAYLPRRKTVITHYFNPFCCLGYCTSVEGVKQVFSARRAYQFFTHLFKE